MRPTFIGSLVCVLAVSASPLAAQDVEKLLGSWTCDTPEGRARLVFHSDNELSYNGERVPYQLLEGALRVVEEFWPVDYKYKFEGDDMIVTNPDFTTTRCRRQAQQQAGPGGGGGLASMLQGHRCDYTSSPDGGASSSRHLYFDGQGRFVLTNDASIWVDGAIASADEVNGQTGSYEVTGNDKGNEVYLHFDDGGESLLYVHVVDGSGRIVELWYKERTFSPALCSQ
jgi:hypothetical protein